MPKNEIKTDPLLQVLENHEWLSRVFCSKKPSARAFRRWITHEVLPVVVRGKQFVDDGSLARLTADLFIECPEFRPQPKQGESK